MAPTKGTRKGWIAATCGITAGLILLDETVVGVALPRMADDLGMSRESAHWVVSAYLLTFAVFAAAAGRAADVVGIRRTFVGGAVLFAAASLLAGGAQTGAELIVARASQGVAAAIVFPVSFALVTTAFPAAERATALGIVTAIGGTMLALGPLVGGVLTSFISWRFIFYINVPICAAAIAGVLILVPRPAPRRPVPFDFAGLALLLPGLILLVLALMEGQTWTYGSALFALVCAGAVACLTAFVWVERRTAAPLVDTALFAIPAVLGGATVFFTGQLAKIVVVVFVPLYLQHTAGLSPVVPGAVMVVAVIGSPFMSVPIGRAADRYGSRLPALWGLAVALLATLAMGVALTVENTAALVAALFIWGLALQAMLVPSAGAVMRAIPHARQGEAGGITVAARLLGGVIGMAAASAVFAVSGRYDVVIYAALPLMAAGLAIGYLTIGRDRDSA